MNDKWRAIFGTLAVRTGLMVVLWTTPALSAAGMPLPDVAGRYALAWGGINLADMFLQSENAGNTTTHRINIRTQGIVDVFASYTATLQAQHDSNALTQNAAFDARFISRKSERTTTLQYDSETGDVTTVSLTKRDEVQQPDVPPSDWPGTLDSLRLIGAARAALLDPDNGDAIIKLAGFDGRKRFDISLIRLGPDMLDIEAGTFPAQRLKLIIDPVSGYDEEELERFQEGRWVEVWVSDDDRAMPLRLRTVGAPFSGSVTLSRDCADLPASCHLED